MTTIFLSPPQKMKGLELLHPRPPPKKYLPPDTNALDDLANPYIIITPYISATTTFPSALLVHKTLLTDYESDLSLSML